MIQYLNGDTTKPVGNGIKIIAHVCNDIGKWDRGFVLALSKKWLEPEVSYRQWYTLRNESDAKKFELGQVQLVFVDKGLYVANMVAQHGITTVNGVPPIRYDALTECLTGVAQLAAAGSSSVHMPRIGCGLAKGNWDEVETIIEQTLVNWDEVEMIIEQTLVNMSVPVYVYDYEPKTY